LRPRTLRLKARVSAKRWSEIEARARARAKILTETVRRRRRRSESFRRALGAVAPEVNWSTYLHWRRCAERRGGAAWERQLDERIPPSPHRVSEAVREAARQLRLDAPGIGNKEVKQRLIEEFGEKEGRVSEASLRRIWREAELSQPRGRRKSTAGAAAHGAGENATKGAATQPEPQETVVQLHGGGGLALLLAAASETKVFEELAAATMKAVELAVQAHGEISSTEEPPGRDERGYFTGEYNRAIRGSAETDPRRVPDEEKRAGRSFGTMTIPHNRPETIALKLFTMGAAPLLTEQRGFDGLDGPAGGWLTVLGGTAYRAATLDRALAELALLNVGEALWTSHAQQWARLTREWTVGVAGEEQPRWLRWVAYVDATQDPYWTHKFAVSGKVSRVGRVMPCLTRVALMGGPGVPLWVETRAGTVSLKKELLPFLARADKVLGPGELGRLTVMDAEMATPELLTSLSGRKERWFITVLKGAVAKGATHTEQGQWEPYRERDLLRELKVNIHGKGTPPEGLSLRGVEMLREGSRHPTPTLFVTSASPDELTTEEIASAYLSRWPHQEDRFRDTRNGVGMDRSHGYSGANVTHVALATAQEKAQKREERAAKAVESAKASEERAGLLVESTPKPSRAAGENLIRAKREHRQAEKQQQVAQQEREKLSTTPREIYVRDTTRDSLVTCLKMTVFMLIEFVLKEYFRGGRMDVRTFIEHFIRLPVVMRRTPTHVVHQIEANLRSPDHTCWLREACDEVTKRNIRVENRVLRFEVLPPLPPSPPPLLSPHPAPDG